VGTGRTKCQIIRTTKTVSRTQKEKTVENITNVIFHSFLLIVHSKTHSDEAHRSSFQKRLLLLFY